MNNKIIILLEYGLKTNNRIYIAKFSYLSFMFNKKNIKNYEIVVNDHKLNFFIL